MLLRKQASYTETFHARLQFRPDQTGYEAGVVLWWSQYSYASIGITLAQQQLSEGRHPVRTVVCTHPTGLHRSMPLMNDGEDRDDYNGTVTARDGDVPDTVMLRIEARPREYHLSLEFDSDSTYEPIKFSVPASALTTMPLVGGAFCGAMYGVYSIGKGEPVLVPADFSDIFVREGH